MVDPGKRLECGGFEWDEGNSEKNWLRHRVSRFECEEIFFNRPFVVAGDEEHSDQEPRWYALGHTDAERNLFLVFTIRAELIRVISARDMSPSERKVYDDAKNQEGTEGDSEV